MELVDAALQRDSKGTNSKFLFYHPVEIGGFLVQCWSFGDGHCGCSIYENGEVVGLKDKRLRHCELIKGAKEGALTDVTLQKLLCFLEAVPAC